MAFDLNAFEQEALQNGIAHYFDPVSGQNTFDLFNGGGGGYYDVTGGPSGLKLYNYSGGPIPQELQSLADKYMLASPEAVAAAMDPNGPGNNQGPSDLMGVLSVLGPVLGAAAFTGGLGGFGSIGGGMESAGGIPELGLVADPATANAAIAGGIPPSMLSGGSGALSLSNLGSIGKGLNTAQSLARALTGGMGQMSQGGGMQGFMQSPTPTAAPYVRKPLPFLDQPAFMENTQQPLGSIEDKAFGQNLSEYGGDVSTRAKQMAATLRGRPGVFAFRSG